LADNGVYVICHSSATDEIIDISDATHSVCNFNGNDAIGLFMNDELVDLVGIIDSDENWGNNKTLVRKSSISQPNEYYDTEEWDEYEIDTFSYLGFHEFTPSSQDETSLVFPEISLYNFPNPFNPTTTIYFKGIENTEEAELIIYNIKGQQIREFNIENSEYKINSIVWNGKDKNNEVVPSGIYLYKLKINNQITSVNKCTMIK